MKTIEYENVKIVAPSSWHDITVAQYEGFFNDSYTSALDKVAYVAKVCNTTSAVLLDLPASVFDRIVDIISFVFESVYAVPSPCIKIGDVKYFVPVEDELTLAAWIDAEAVRKADNQIISGSLAIVCRPVGEAYDPANSEARQAMFASLPVNEVLPVISFFFRLSTVLKSNSQTYSSLLRTLDQLPPLTAFLSTRTGGIKLSTIWLSVKYSIMKKYMTYRLSKYTRTFNIYATKITPKTNNVN